MKKYKMYVTALFLGKMNHIDTQLVTWANAGDTTERLYRPWNIGNKECYQSDLQWPTMVFINVYQ